MGPVGKRILFYKRLRSGVARDHDPARFNYLTDFINKLATGEAVPLED